MITKSISSYSVKVCLDSQRLFICLSQSYEIHSVFTFVHEGDCESHIE